MEIRTDQIEFEEKKLMEFKLSEWNKSYTKGDNLLFWPHEEIIRFVSKYIRKRIDITEFAQIKDFQTALDLGCGIGRHVKYLDEMGFDPFGVDLSDVAIAKGKQWFRQLGREDLAERLIVGNILDLPYDNNQFDFVVSHGVLDSMEFDIAYRGMSEIARVLKTGGYFYFDLIMEPSMKAFEEIVAAEHEQGTVQSYFNISRVTQLLGDSFHVMEFKVISISNEKDIVSNRRAHIICERK